MRLNQAAATALMARLEAQKAICDSSERELHKKFKQRDELEKQIRPEWEQARKRSRMDDSITEGSTNGSNILCLPGTEPDNGMQITVSTASMLEEDQMNTYLERLKSKISHKELRKYLEEEQRASEEGYASKQQELEEGSKQAILRSIEGLKDFNNVKATKEDENLAEQHLPKLDFPSLDEPEIKEDEESRKQRGKGNVEKWLQMLLDDTQGDANLNHQNDDENEPDRTSEIIRKLDLVYPQKEHNISKAQESKDKKDLDQVSNQPPISAKASGKREVYFEREVRESTHSKNEEEGKKRRESVPMKFRDTPTKNPPYRLKSDKCREEVVGASVMENRKSYGGNERKEKVGKGKEIHRSESARTFRRIPSSPSLIFSGMKKRVDCIVGKKPLVSGDDDGNENSIGENNLIKSTIRTIKRAVKF